MAANCNFRRKHAALRLRPSDEFLPAMIDAIADPLFVKDRDHRWIFLNDRFCKFMGFDRETLIGRSDYDFFPKEQADLFWANDEAVFQSGTENVSEEAFTDAAGRTHCISTKKTLFVDGDGGQFIVGIIRDITDRKQAEAKLRHLAFHDGLTGLHNRVSFEHLLQQALRDCRPQGGEVAVVLVDLDRFKVVNDTLGHHAGDRLLAAAAQRIRTCLRKEDAVARMGGDEFAVLLKRVGDGIEAAAIAERIHKALRDPFDVEGSTVYLSASLGIALSSVGEERPKDLMRFADIAMYRAKRHMRGSSQLFDESLDSAATQVLHAENELRRAVEREEFAVFFQPLVDLESSRILGAEALVRWHHPSRGLVEPGAFIPLAEETGLIVPIGNWVLRAACREAARWKQRGWLPEGFLLTVNLSAAQLRDPGLADLVRHVLEETGIRPQELALEITENSIAQITPGIHQLRKSGVRLAIDDFGTGYASLGILRELPVDILKVARTFTMGLDDGGSGRSLVHAILVLARELGLTTVAEGIEAPGHAAMLRQMRCHLGQGFLYSRPIEAASFAEFLAEQKSQDNPELPLGVTRLAICKP